jgi:proton-translocating NADH-quinone oxidoreductase chain M
MGSSPFSRTIENIVMRFNKYASIKIKAFQRKFNLYFFPLSWFFKKAELYAIKNKKSVILELREEGLSRKQLSAQYLFSVGKFGFYVFVVSNLVAAFFLKIFPFIVSDTIYDTFFFFFDNPLLFLLFVPLFTVVILCFIPRQFESNIKWFSVYSSGLIFFFSVFLLGFFDLSSEDFQFQYRMQLLEGDQVYISFLVGVDGLSILLLTLTNFLFFVCFFLNTLFLGSDQREKIISFFLLQFFILMAFCSLNVILFYLAFEATLIPMVIIIGLFGSRERKIYAAYKLFFYTLVSSLFMLTGLVSLLFITGTGDLTYLLSTTFSVEYQNIVWLLLFVSFAVKLPMIPFHLWLPEAHVEAPTAGSIILAGILLKLGGYGFFRFLLPLFPQATVYFMPLVGLLSLLAILVASSISLRQIDLKKVIAYSSIAHMGFVSLAMPCMNEFTTVGAAFIMLSHGFVSSALFMHVGFLYDRYKTKLIVYYGSLASTMPIFTSFFFFFLLANISLPSTSSFIGEFLVLTGAVKVMFFIAGSATLSVILVVGYSLWLFNRICFGALNTKYIVLYQDINLTEFMLSIALAFPVLIFGLCPNYLIEYLEYFSAFLSGTFELFVH